MPVYDLIEIIAERIYSRRRRRLRSLVKGSQVTEVGVGIVKNPLHYRPDLRVKVIDLAPGMLERATPAECGSDARIQMMIVTSSPDIRHYWTLPQDAIIGLETEHTLSVLLWLCLHREIPSPHRWRQFLSSLHPPTCFRSRIAPIWVSGLAY